MTPRELHYADRAALLDPRAYVFRRSTTFSDTVPDGEAWYVLNAFFLSDGLATPSPWFHRDLDLDSAMPAGPGTVLAPFTGPGAGIGFVYYCRPARVTAIDERYGDDPEGLYYGRLEQLKVLPFRPPCSIRIPAGTAVATGSIADFDWGTSTAGYGILRHISGEGVPWTLLHGRGTPDENANHRSLNTIEEIDDQHHNRLSCNVVVPFQRYDPDTNSGFGSLRTRAANFAGNGLDLTEQDLYSVAHWSILPDGW